MSEYEPKVSYYSADTQRIANKLPDWTKIRRQKDSSGQAFLNPIGVQVEQLDSELEDHLRNLFIDLVDPDVPDQLRKVQLPVTTELLNPQTINNWLFNSSFEIVTSHDRLPDYWRSEGTGTVTISSGFLGTRGLQLQVTSGQSIAVYQEVDEAIRSGVYWCFYIWYSSTAAGLTAPSSGFGLEVTGTAGDGSTETIRTAFTPNTYGHARRCVIRGSFSSDVVKIKFRVVVTNSGGFNITTPVLIDMAMALEGDVVPNWKPNPFDNYPYIPYYGNLAPVVSEYTRHTQYVERIEDFWTEALPTRVSGPTLLSSGGTLDSDPVADATGFASYGQSGTHTEVDMWKDEWEFTWELGLQGSTPKVRGYGVDAPDILGPFDIAFRNYRNWFEDGVSWVPEAMTNLHGYLLCVVKKTDWNGTTKRYLAIVDPRMPRPFPTYMEVTSMIELTGISTSTKISRAEIKYSDQQHLYVGNGESEWAYVLHYDYFMIDRSEKLMYFREAQDYVVPQLLGKGLREMPLETS
jgi:hypothetical protein